MFVSMNKYLTIPVHQIQRFHQENKENGFDRLISLDTFYAARNGYLINDFCVFGVQVYEVKYSSNGEALKIIENPREVTFNWTIPYIPHIAKINFIQRNLQVENING
ncbi:hypothetical protein POM88_028800 [Heracleum sosnowskyi]|uniref:MATH domain-containing protein n=1 Tax=Heracleum sosnowskyi TaxID=360622 RepID=A0AAD8HSK0_9APIA|nr:hypothetical protein POM88_028800 [Heracleum sosnowskyi]